MVKKRILQIHRWLGLISGLVVFIVGITGAMYAFENELRSCFYKNRFEVDVVDKPFVHPDSLFAAAQYALGKEFPVSRVEFDNEPGKAVAFYSLKADYDAPFFWQKIIYSKVAFIDPYTGAVIKVDDIKWEFFSVVLAIHTSLLMGHAGSLVIGWSTALFVVLLISGLILWYPKNKAAARQRFWFRWKATTSVKRKNYDLHNIAGFYAFLILLTIALTGLVWSFDWWEKSVITIANGGKKIVRPKPVFSDTTQPFSPLQLSGPLQKIQAEFPDSRRYVIYFPTEKAATVSAVIPGEGRKRYQFRQISFDRYSNKLISRSPPFINKSSGEQLRNMNIDIHTGSILGFAGKLLAFFASLIAASLPVTGFYIWWGKKKRVIRHA